MTIDHYYGVKRIEALLEELNQFEGNVTLDADVEHTMTIRFALLDAARDQAAHLARELAAAARIVA
jgi:hypothetical protein